VIRNRGGVRLPLVSALVFGSLALGGCSSLSTVSSTSPIFCTQTKALVGSDLNRLIPMSQYQEGQAASPVDIQETVNAARKAAKSAPTKALAGTLTSLASALQASNGDPTRVEHAINALVPFYKAYVQRCSSQLKALSDPKTEVRLAHTMQAVAIVGAAVGEAAREGRPAGSDDVGLVIALAGIVPKTKVSVTRPLGSIPGSPRVVELSINTGTGATAQCVLVPDSVGGIPSATPCPGS
jgi:hypothetical protein